MAAKILGTNLFGEPVLARREGPGRPEAVWNRETSNKVLLAFALGWTVKRTADLVRLSVPTLRKVYFSECQERRLAADRLELQSLALLVKEAENGNVAANKELDKRLEKLRRRDTAVAMASSPPKPPKKGKKEEAKERAAGVRGKFEPPPPPSHLIN